MPESRKKHHEKRTPQKGKQLPEKRLVFGGHLGQMPPELQTAVRERFSVGEMEALERCFRRAERAGSDQGAKEAASLIWLATLRIAHDRLGAEREALEEMVTLTDEYLKDILEGRLSLEDIRRSLVSDGLDISVVTAEGTKGGKT